MGKTVALLCALACLSICPDDKAEAPELAVATAEQLGKAYLKLGSERPPAEDSGEDVRGECEERRVAIGKALARSKQGWDGIYTCGGGYEAFVLHLSLDAGFYYAVPSDVGMLDWASGDIASVAGNAVEFQNIKARDWRRRVREGDLSVPMYGPVMHVISLGQRDFIVPRERLVGFCNDWNAGRLPQRFLSREVEGREPASTSAAAVLAQIPAEFHPFILESEIQGAVIELRDTRTAWSQYPLVSGSSEDGWVTATLVVDIGRADGLLPGMRLYRGGGERNTLIRVLKCAEDSSMARLVLWKEEANFAEWNGVLLSTKER